MGDEEGTQAGSDTYPMQASAIKKNGYGMSFCHLLLLYLIMNMSD